MAPLQDRRPSGMDAARRRVIDGIGIECLRLARRPETQEPIVCGSRAAGYSLSQVETPPLLIGQRPLVGCSPEGCSGSLLFLQPVMPSETTATISTDTKNFLNVLNKHLQKNIDDAS